MTFRSVLNLLYEIEADRKIKNHIQPMKYIDAEKLYEHLEQVSEFYPRYADNFLDNAVINVINGIKTFITSLQQEQPEVDFEKELDRWRHAHFSGKRDGDYSGEYLERKSQLDIARHFYELGCRHAAAMYDDIEFERQRRQSDAPSSLQAILR